MIESERAIGRVFAVQRGYRHTVKASTAEERRDKLTHLKHTIRANEDGIYAALDEDFRKPALEVALSEIGAVYAEIDMAVAGLDTWMRDVEIEPSPHNHGARARLRYEPRGVCLIISPWNYPFQLLFNPLVAAIAAGNCCMLKPSELTPATSRLSAKIAREAFDESEVALFEGAADVATALLGLPFDHIFYTGNSAVGRIVMQAAAKHLASVTLELGGKSPALVDATADLDRAAAKIAWGKFANAGQTCVAPDHVFVEETKRDAFLEKVQAFVRRAYYTEDGTLNERDISQIVSERHFDRLQRLFDDAVRKGATVVLGGVFDRATRTVHPAVLADVTDDMLIMQEEVFGPILPVLTYRRVDEALAHVDAGSKPLALYVFSADDAFVEDVLRRSTSGGACVNDVMVHLSERRLPFGGVNASGLGSYHGVFGFRAFSHERAVFYQTPNDTMAQRYPPFAGKVDALRRPAPLDR